MVGGVNVRKPPVNVALSLTLLRIALIPLLIVCFYVSSAWGYTATILVFVLAALTDWLDGYIARSMQQTSKFGAFLDPVADKLLVVTALILIISESVIPYLAVPALLVVCREIIVSALREWMAQAGKSDNVAVSYAGKIKTTVQLTAIIWLLCTREGYFLAYYWLQIMGFLILCIAALLSVWTVTSYSISAVRACKS